MCAYVRCVKIGDLVICKPGRRILADDREDELGVIIYEQEYEESGKWYCVQWFDDYLWHHIGDLELVNESR